MVRAMFWAGTMRLQTWASERSGSREFLSWLFLYPVCFDFIHTTSRATYCTRTDWEVGVMVGSGDFSGGSLSQGIWWSVTEQSTWQPALAAVHIPAHTQMHTPYSSTCAHVHTLTCSHTKKRKMNVTEKGGFIQHLPFSSMILLWTEAMSWSCITWGSISETIRSGLWPLHLC